MDFYFTNEFILGHFIDFYQRFSISSLIVNDNIFCKLITDK